MKRILTLALTVSSLAVSSLTMLSLSTTASAAAIGESAIQKSDSRIVSAGNGITEIIYALGAGDQVIAVDSTSNYPNDVHKLPKLGYHKQMSAEGILALKPTMLIGTDDMGPPATITQLEMAGLEIESYPVRNSAENIHLRITEVATLLNREAEGEKLWQTIENNLNQARTLSEGQKKPRVIFVLAMGDRNPSISGSGTAADALIEMAGGVNPAKEQFASYKPLSNEALLTLAPDIILYSDRGDGTTPDQLLNMQPILKQTPAGKSGRLISLDGRMLLGGLGPRTGDMVLDLAEKFYPES